MDFYETLGVPRSATTEEIRKAYKRKAREHHPDMHSGPEQAKHAELFKLVVAAFEVLSDPAKKSQYDVQGYYGRRPTTPPPRRPAKTKTKEEFEREKKEKNKQEARARSRSAFEPMDINCSFFGGEGSGRSILCHVKLTPQEMKNGCMKSVTVKKRDFCGTCGGDGEGLFVCGYCKNKANFKEVCPHCNYQGVLDSKCPTCKGTGAGLWMIEEVVFKVSPNTQPGHSINILGRGEEAARKPPGNVRVILL